MTIHQRLSGIAVLLAFALTAFYPTSFAAIFAIIFSICLYAFSIFIQEKRAEDVDLLKQRMSDIESKLSNISIGKAMGR